MGLQLMYCIDRATTRISAMPPHVTTHLSSPVDPDDQATAARRRLGSARTAVHGTSAQRTSSASSSSSSSPSVSEWDLALDLRVTTRRRSRSSLEELGT
jgi:hypothetical protein